ncbi:MAG: hypothetical protein JNM18_05455 [Planctomycetaceae bacterium]|nr:hypothetical protein [Planctomycetaceae bacterium]
MSPRPVHAQSDDDDEDDFDPDVYDSDDLELVPCPHCGSEIYEETERCPQCGEYVNQQARLGVNRPLWFIVTALVCLYVVWRSMF